MQVFANFGSFMPTFGGSISSFVRGRLRVTFSPWMSVILILRAVCFYVAT